MSGLEARIAEVLGEAWDAGNCTGLDGWVGPGRGAGEVDNDALAGRQRDTARLAAMLAPVIREAQAEALDALGVELFDQNKKARTAPNMTQYQRGRADSYEASYALAGRRAIEKRKP